MKKLKTADEKKLVNFRMNKKARDLLDELQISFALSSKADVLSKALTLLKIAEEAHSKNEKILIRGENTETEIKIC